MSESPPLFVAVSSVDIAVSHPSAAAKRGKRKEHSNDLSDFEYDVSLSDSEQENHGKETDRKEASIAEEKTEKLPVTPKRTRNNIKSYVESDEDNEVSNVQTKPRSVRKRHRYSSDDEYNPGLDKEESPNEDEELLGSPRKKNMKRRGRRPKSEITASSKKDDQEQSKFVKVTDIRTNLTSENHDSDIENNLSTCVIQASQPEISTNGHSSDQPLNKVCDKTGSDSSDTPHIISMMVGETTVSKITPTSEMNKAFEQFCQDKNVTGSANVQPKAKSRIKPHTSQTNTVVTSQQKNTTNYVDTSMESESDTKNVKLRTYSDKYVQVSSPFENRVVTCVNLSQEQKSNACSFIEDILKTTSELGELMGLKANEFLSKKVNTENIKDTIRLDYCVNKAFLLFKLAKDNITNMEETLKQNYDSFMDMNNLKYTFEDNKEIKPKVMLKSEQPDSSDSDCEIVGVCPSSAVSRLSNEISISIKSSKTSKKTTAVPKPSTSESPDSVINRHAVWINKSNMAIRVKGQGNQQQSFLEQDSRILKPPDRKNQELTIWQKHFLENDLCNMKPKFISVLMDGNAVTNYHHNVCKNFRLKGENNSKTHVQCCRSDLQIDALKKFDWLDLSTCVAYAQDAKTLCSKPVKVHRSVSSLQSEETEDDGFWESEIEDDQSSTHEIGDVQENLGRSFTSKFNIDKWTYCNNVTYSPKTLLRIVLDKLHKYIFNPNEPVSLRKAIADKMKNSFSKYFEVGDWIHDTNCLPSPESLFHITLRSINHNIVYKHTKRIDECNTDFSYGYSALLTVNQISPVYAPNTLQMLAIKVLNDSVLMTKSTQPKTTVLNKAATSIVPIENKISEHFFTPEPLTDLSLSALNLHINNKRPPIHGTVRSLLNLCLNVLNKCTNAQLKAMCVVCAMPEYRLQNPKSLANIALKYFNDNCTIVERSDVLHKNVDDDIFIPFSLKSEQKQNNHSYMDNHVFQTTSNTIVAINNGERSYDSDGSTCDDYIDYFQDWLMSDTDQTECALHSCNGSLEIEENNTNFDETKIGNSNLKQKKNIKNKSKKSHGTKKQSVYEQQLPDEFCKFPTICAEPSAEGESLQIKIDSITGNVTFPVEENVIVSIAPNYHTENYISEPTRQDNSQKNARHNFENVIVKVEVNDNLLNDEPPDDDALITDDITSRSALVKLEPAVHYIADIKDEADDGNTQIDTIENYMAMTKVETVFGSCETDNVLEENVIVGANSNNLICMPIVHVKMESFRSEASNSFLDGSRQYEDLLEVRNRKKPNKSKTHVGDLSTTVNDADNLLEIRGRRVQSSTNEERGTPSGIINKKKELQVNRKTELQASSITGEKRSTKKKTHVAKTTPVSETVLNKKTITSEIISASPAQSSDDEGSDGPRYQFPDQALEELEEFSISDENLIHETGTASHHSESGRESSPVRYCFPDQVAPSPPHSASDKDSSPRYKFPDKSSDDQGITTDNLITLRSRKKIATGDAISELTHSKEKYESSIKKSVPGANNYSTETNKMGQVLAKHVSDGIIDESLREDEINLPKRKMQGVDDQMVDNNHVVPSILQTKLLDNDEISQPTSSYANRNVRVKEQALEPNNSIQKVSLEKSKNISYEVVEEYNDKNETNLNKKKRSVFKISFKNLLNSSKDHSSDVVDAIDAMEKPRQNIVDGGICESALLADELQTETPGNEHCQKDLRDILFDLLKSSSEDEVHNDIMEYSKKSFRRKREKRNLKILKKLKSKYGNTGVDKGGWMTFAVQPNDVKLFTPSVVLINKLPDIILEMYRGYLDDRAEEREIENLLNFSSLQIRRRDDHSSDSTEYTTGFSNLPFIRPKKRKKRKVQSHAKDEIRNLRLDNESETDSEMEIFRVKQKALAVRQISAKEVERKNKAAKDALLASSSDELSLGEVKHRHKRKFGKTKHLANVDPSLIKENNVIKEQKKWVKNKLLIGRLSETDSEEEERRWLKRKERERLGENCSHESSSKRRNTKSSRRRAIRIGADLEVYSSDDNTPIVRKNLACDKERHLEEKNIDMNSAADSKDIKPVDQKSPKGRKNIRRLIDKNSLAESTKLALRNEEERKHRLFARNKVRDSLANTKEIILDINIETKKPVFTLHPGWKNLLKQHQIEGLKFMWDACFESVERAQSGDKGGGCILAHCMGLGKTLQVISLFHTVLTQKVLGIRCILVCCPLSTVLNWVDELNKWLKAIGEPKSIKVFELSKLKKNYERGFQLEDWHREGGVFVIGYEMFRHLTSMTPEKDKVRPVIVKKITTTLLDPGPCLVVCDEGHLLKNENSALAKTMNRISTKRRIALTGTPLQNNLREYYCMVNFVKPNLLGTYREYFNRFENPITNGQHRDSSTNDIRIMKHRSHVLHRMLEYVLQRKEVSILYPYLPKKHEYVLLISLTDCQVNLYQFYLMYLSSRNAIKKSILKDYHNLQRIWTHPRVLHYFHQKTKESMQKKPNKSGIKLEIKEEIGLEDELAQQDAMAHDNEDLATGTSWWTQFLDESQLDMLELSHKFATAFNIIDESVRIGDKLLLFSTSLYTLDALEYFLHKIKQWSVGVQYYRLDGSVPLENRQKWCREFNNENNTEAKLFLISTRAGGLGINMIAANRVIIMDASWNPSHDMQSIFRVYRFGQVKECYIYRLIAVGTMEEKIYERSVTKQAIALRVVDEQQIDRHYNMAELNELYNFTIPAPVSEQHLESLPVPSDALLARLLMQRMGRGAGALASYHEHDSLLRHVLHEGLDEAEQKRAWDDYKAEQAAKEAAEAQRTANAAAAAAAQNASEFSHYLATLTANPSQTALQNNPAVPMSVPHPTTVVAPPLAAAYSAALMSLGSQGAAADGKLKGLLTKQNQTIRTASTGDRLTLDIRPMLRISDTIDMGNLETLRKTIVPDVPMNVFAKVYRQIRISDPELSSEAVLLEVGRMLSVWKRTEESLQGGSTNNLKSDHYYSSQENSRQTESSDRSLNAKGQLPKKKGRPRKKKKGRPKKIDKTSSLLSDRGESLLLNHTDLSLPIDVESVLPIFESVLPDREESVLPDCEESVLPDCEESVLPDCGMPSFKLGGPDAFGSVSDACTPVGPPIKSSINPDIADFLPLFDSDYEGEQLLPHSPDSDPTYTPTRSSKSKKRTPKKHKKKDIQLRKSIAKRVLQSTVSSETIISGDISEAAILGHTPDHSHPINAEPAAVIEID